MSEGTARRLPWFLLGLLVAAGLWAAYAAGRRAGSAGRVSNAPDFQPRILRKAGSPRAPPTSASINSTF